MFIGIFAVFRTDCEEPGSIKTIRFDCKDKTNIFSAQIIKRKSYVIIFASFLFGGLTS
jgi:hypothetical protein